MISTAKLRKTSVIGTAAARMLTRPVVATLLACALALLLPAIPAPCCTVEHDSDLGDVESVIDIPTGDHCLGCPIGFPGTTSTEYPDRDDPCVDHLALFQELCGISIVPNEIPPARTPNPIYLRQGAVVEQAIDLQLPGPVPGWVGARTYNSRVWGSAALAASWVGNFVDYRLINEANGDKRLIVDATSKRVFTKIEDEQLHQSGRQLFHLDVRELGICPDQLGHG